MGAYANTWRGNLVGGAIVVALVAVGAVYGVITVFPGAPRTMEKLRHVLRSGPRRRARAEPAHRGDRGPAARDARPGDEVLLIALRVYIFVAVPIVGYAFIHALATQ